MLLQAQYAAQYGIDPNAVYSGYYQQDAYTMQQLSGLNGNGYPATAASYPSGYGDSAVMDPYSYQNYEERAYYSPNEGYDPQAMAGGAYYDEQYPPVSGSYDPYATSGAIPPSSAGYYPPTSQQTSMPCN